MADALLLVFSRNEFYHRKYQMMIGIFLLSLVVNSILVGLIIFLEKHPTHPLYFVTDQAGRLVKNMPLTVPNSPVDDVANWTVKAVEAAYTYDFVNYRAQFQSAQKYFTDYGWRNYMQALKLSNNLLALTDHKYVVIAKVVNKPTLIKQGILGDAFAWKFQMPVLVTYLSPPYTDGPKSKISNALTVTVIVQRQNVLQNYQGLGIIQLIASS